MVLGVVGTLVAARLLGRADFGRFAIVLAATSFFQLLLDVTAEEALVKYGFRFAESGEWGRLHRLFRRVIGVKAAGAILAAGGLAGLAPVADTLFGTSGLRAPLLVAALIPVFQAPENLGGTALLLRGRYDVRSVFLSVSQGLRLAAIAVAASHGLTAIVVGLAVATALGSLSIATAGWFAFRRFPAAEPEPIGPERREIVRFVLHTSAATGIVSLRSPLGMLVLGLVSNPAQVGYFRVAQAPQIALAALSSPARLILLTEQTRDWERGERAAVFRSVRRYVLGAIAALAVLLPPLLVFMPDLIRLTYSAKYLGATDAARLVLGAAALQLVFGWTKSFPVSIGRPGLRTLGYALEAAVLIPLAAFLGRKWGATGAGGAVLGAAVASSALWAVLLMRLRREHVTEPARAAALGRETVQP